MSLPAAEAPPPHAEAQKNRILDAAQRCFIEHGFHAASMANIAAAAQMSAGLIYRYFENKSAITLAIIERQVARQLDDIAGLQTGCDLVTMVGDIFARWQSGDPQNTSPSLYLEISAEASRNPMVAKAVAQADSGSLEHFDCWLEKTIQAAGGQPTPEDIRRRSLLLRCLIEGLVVRSVRDPSLDPATVGEHLRYILPFFIAPGAAPSPPG